MATTKTRTAIRIAGGPQHIRSREAWGNSDRVQTGYLSVIGTPCNVKTFASQRSAEQWIRRYSASILPSVWGHLTLGEAQAQGLLEVMTY